MNVRHRQQDRAGLVIDGRVDEPVGLHGEIGHVPPTEFEAKHYRQINSQQQPLPGEPSLH